MAGQLSRFPISDFYLETLGDHWSLLDTISCIVAHVLLDYLDDLGDADA